MEKCLVSVVIPAYCCASVITGAIESALLQQVPLEVLVIDDRSPDDLEQVMEGYREEPRVHYLKNVENMGAAATRNRGVLEARGEYIAFLDADDLWAEGKLKKQLEALNSSGASLCCTARALMDGAGTPTGRVIPVREKITFRQLCRHNSINCSSVLIKTDVIRQFPMEYEDSHEDYITWLKVLKEYGPACGVNEPLLLYRVSHTGKSGRKGHSAKMTWKAYGYMKFSWPEKLWYFCCYAVNGIWKHYLR